MFLNMSKPDVNKAFSHIDIDQNGRITMDGIYSIELLKKKYFYLLIFLLNRIYFILLPKFSSSKKKKYKVKEEETLRFRNEFFILL